MARSKKDTVGGHTKRDISIQITGKKGYSASGWTPHFRSWAKRQMRRSHRAYSRITMSELLHEFEEQQREEQLQQWLEDECLDHFEEDWSDYDRDMDIWDYYDEPDDMSDFEYGYDDPWYDDDYRLSSYAYDPRNDTSRYQVIDTGTDAVVTEGKSLADILIEIQKLQLS